MRKAIPKKLKKKVEVSSLKTKKPYLLGAISKKDEEKPFYLLRKSVHYPKIIEVDAVAEKVVEEKFQSLFAKELDRAYRSI